MQPSLLMRQQVTDHPAPPPTLCQPASLPSNSPLTWLSLVLSHVACLCCRLWDQECLCTNTRNSNTEAVDTRELHAYMLAWLHQLGKDGVQVLHCRGVHGRIGLDLIGANETNDHAMKAEAYRLKLKKCMHFSPVRARTRTDLYCSSVNATPLA